MLDELHSFGADVDLATTKGEYHPPFRTFLTAALREANASAVTLPGGVGGTSPFTEGLTPTELGFCLLGFVQVDLLSGT